MKPLRVNYRDASTHIKGIKPNKLYRSSVCFTPPTDGIKAIVDLRRNGAQMEKWHLPSDNGIVNFQRHHIPMVGKRGAVSLLSALPISTIVEFCYSGGSETVVGKHYFANPDNIVDMYMRIAENASYELGAIARIIADPTEGGTVIFCVAGKDRTGIVIALFARLAGASIEDIADDYAMSQNHLHAAKHEGGLALFDPLLVDSVLTQSPWESMVAFLRTIETRYKSVDKFFEIKLGLEREVIDQVISALKA
jgi:hypothetical protein